MLLAIVLGSAIVFANLHPKITYPFTRLPNGVVSGVLTQGWPFTYYQNTRVTIGDGEAEFIEKWYWGSLFANVSVGALGFIAAKRLVDYLNRHSKVKGR